MGLAMLSLFNIQCSTGSYDVSLAAPKSKVQKPSYGTRVCIIDKVVMPAVSLEHYEIVIPIKALETNKTLDEVGRVIVEMKTNLVTREDTVDVIGGGILQDIGTLSTSIYMRGLKWNYFPTTLLGMVDSCIGGKSSINHGGYKNIIGNYHPPSSVFIYPSFCDTLDESKILEGIFEAVKICIAFGQPNLDKVCDMTQYKNDKLFSDLTGLIELSLSAKKHFIEIDEFDKGPRLLLNFGHTFGHAIEAATNYRVPHGIAVGVGMLMAFDIVSKVVVNSTANANNFALVDYIKNLLNVWPQKNCIEAWLDPHVAFKAFENDKKHSNKNFNIILPTSDNRLEMVSIKRDEKNKATIFSTFDQIGSII